MQFFVNFFLLSCFFSVLFQNILFGNCQSIADVAVEAIVNKLPQGVVAPLIASCFVLAEAQSRLKTLESDFHGLRALDECSTQVMLAEGGEDFVLGKDGHLWLSGCDGSCELATNFPVSKGKKYIKDIVKDDAVRCLRMSLYGKYTKLPLQQFLGKFRGKSYLGKINTMVSILFNAQDSRQQEVKRSFEDFKEKIVVAGYAQRDKDLKAADRCCVFAVGLWSMAYLAHHFSGLK